MPNMEYRIGIENEMYLEVDGLDPPKLKGKSDFEGLGDKLVSLYTQNRGNALLRKDFSHTAHPGHYDDHNKWRNWTVTTDDGIGDLVLDDQAAKGCTYSCTLRGGLIFIRLTII